MMKALASIQSMSNEEILYKLLQKECGYYRVVLELTRTENEKLIRERPLNELHPIIRKKSIIMSCIGDIDKALEPLKRQWNQGIRDGNEQQSSVVSKQLKHLGGLIEEILVLDQENQQMMRRNINSMKSKVKSLPSV